jgi:hypothetical protein
MQQQFLAAKSKRAIQGQVQTTSQKARGRVERSGGVLGGHRSGHCVDTDLWIPVDGIAAVVDTASASSSVSNATLNWLLLTRAVVSYVVTIITYVRLQGSDPSYLNADMLDELGDGYNSRGEKIEAADEDTKEVVAQHDIPAEQMGERMIAVSGTSPPSTMSSLLLPKTSMTRRFRRTVPAGANDDDQSTAAETVTLMEVVSVSVPVVVSPVHPQQYTSTRRKFCRTCQLAPPLRAHHCKSCRRCVATFDHHCDFVGTCIGERNRCRFWWFLAAQAVSFLQSLALVESSSGIDYSFPTTTTLSGWARFCNWKVLRIVIVKLYLYPLTAAAVAMLWIHTVWALGNTTTFEWSRSKHLEYLQGFRPVIMDWPFSRNILSNLCLFCLVPSSRNDNDTLQQPKVAVVGDSSSSSSRSKNPTTAWKPTIWQPPRRGGGKFGGGHKHSAVPTEKSRRMTEQCNYQSASLTD